MDKKYQVFVSSTFTDLQEERRAVMETLLEMPCIPVGMELFPASDEAQLEYIKRAIAFAIDHRPVPDPIHVSPPLNLGRSRRQ